MICWKCVWNVRTGLLQQVNSYKSSTTVVVFHYSGWSSITTHDHPTVLVFFHYSGWSPITTHDHPTFLVFFHYSGWSPITTHDHPTFLVFFHYSGWSPITTHDHPAFLVSASKQCSEVEYYVVSNFVGVEARCDVQWNTSMMDTIGSQPYSEVSLTQELLVYFW